MEKQGYTDGLYGIPSKQNPDYEYLKGYYEGQKDYRTLRSNMIKEYEAQNYLKAIKTKIFEKSGVKIP